MYREPAAWHSLMDRLVTMTIAYLGAQVTAGAQVVQLFDSWVGGLGPAAYARYVQPHVRAIFDAVEVPAIHFGTGASSLLELMAEAGGDVIGIDHRLSLAQAWSRVGDRRGIQGNLDAARLLAGWEATADGARAILREAGGRPGHIFNLGHGVLPQTNPDLLRRLVDLVHETTARGGLSEAAATAAPG
jgi:uroporphyrinogen decarboxylase